MGLNLKLQVVLGKPSGRSLLFGPGEYLLGRGPECQVRFSSDWVSRQHCQITVTGEGAVLRDLGSRNGTLVNGSLIQEARLWAGDRVQIGQVAFEVSYVPQGGAPLEPPSTGDDPRDGGSGSTEIYPVAG